MDYRDIHISHTQSTINIKIEDPSNTALHHTLKFTKTFYGANNRNNNIDN